MARWLRRRVVFLHSQRSTAPGQHAPAAVVSPQVEYLGCGQLSCWHGAAHPNQCFFMVKIVTFITSATPQGSKRSRCLQQTQTSAPKMSPQCAAVRRSAPQPSTSSTVTPANHQLHASAIFRTSLSSPRPGGHLHQRRGPRCGTTRW